MYRPGALLLSTLGLSVLCLTSCTDILGLDGITYDQGQTQAEPTGGATADIVDEPPPGVGGEPLIEEEYQDKDFPAFWPDDSLIVTLPASLDSNYYWVYRPSEKLLYSYELNFVGVDLLGTQAWPEDVPLSHLVAVPSAEGPLLIAYSDMGWATWVRNVLGTGELETESGYASEDRTHVFVANRAGIFLLVAYDTVDGAYRYVTADPEIEAEPGLGNWGPGWTHLQPYTALGKEGILLFNALTQEVSFRAFGEPGEELEELFSGSIDFPASEMVTLWQGTAAQIAFYDAGAGVLTLRDLVAAGEEGVAWGASESAWGKFVEVARLPEDLKFLAPLDQSPGILLGFNGTTAGIYHAEDEPPIIVK